MGSFSFWHWIVLGLIGVVLWRVLGRGESASPAPGLGDLRPPGHANEASTAPEKGPLIKGNETFSISVAGSAHHQDAYRRAFRSKLSAARKEVEGEEIGDGDTTTVEFTASLVLDDKNAHDANAVRVEFKGELIGYVPKGIAPLLRDYLNTKAKGSMICRCRAEVDLPLHPEGMFEASLDLPRLKA